MTIGVKTMRFLLVALFAVASCEGARYQPCYHNNTCDKGLTCVWLKRHGSQCATWEDVQVADGDRQWHHVLPDGGTRQ